MFKVVFLSLALLTIAAQSAPAEKTPEESRAELLAAGLSPQAADGLVKIGSNAQASFPKDGPTPSPMEAIGAVIKLFQDMDAFIKTQSPQDQAAYNQLLEKKKREMEALFAAGNH